MMHRFLYWFRRRQFDAELDSEMRFHLETRAAELEAQGGSPSDALQQARREFGSVAGSAEQTREAWQFRWLEDLFADFRYAARTCRRSPVFTLTAALSLGLGIGANTTIFSVVKAILYSDMGLKNPGELVAFRQNRAPLMLSWLDLQDYTREVKAFQGLTGCYPIIPASFGGGNEPERLWGQLVMTNYFSVLGAEPRIGRAFRDDENQAQVVIISDGLWRRAFAANPSIIGTKVMLSGAQYEIVGVAAPGFAGSVRGLLSDFWVPLGVYPRVAPGMLRQGKPEELRNYGWLHIDARMQPGVTLREAETALRTVSQRLDQLYPRRNKRLISLAPSGTFPFNPDQVRLFLAVLLGVVGLVLVVACANVANLLLARAAARRQEMGIRLAIGAGRGRLIRQLLAESLFLAFGGALVGVGFAFFATRLLGSLQSSFPISVVFDTTIDARILAATLGVSVLAGILFGLAPALEATRPELNSILQDSDSVVSRLRRLGLRNGFVVLQMAVSLVLLIVAGLFLRSLHNASAVPLGFSSEGIVMFGFDPRATGYSEVRSVQLFRRLRERIEALPGVESSGIVDVLPLNMHPQGAAVSRRESIDRLIADMYAVSPRYLETMGIRRIAGRDLQSNYNGKLQAVINESLARRLYGNQDPIGQRIDWEAKEHTVVGVVADTKSRSLAEVSQPQIYVSLEHEYDQMWGFFGVVLAVKTRGNPAAIATAIRSEMREIDPSLAVYNIQTMREYVSKALLLPRLCGILFGVFGVVGLTLAIVGLYGVISYGVRRRTREIGIRMAIGATPSDVVSLIALEGLGVTLFGTAIGLAVSLAVSKILAQFLLGIGPRDLATFTAVPAILIVVAAAAVWFPAKRASHAEVLRTIRHE